MALFSKQNREVFTNPLNLDHPILGQVLGICSALAVTSQNPYRGAVGCCGCSRDYRFSDSEGIRLRRERSVERVCRSDYHQLYPHGTFGGFCHAEQALAFVP